MKTYEFLPEAEEEMNEAARFYERRKNGLGLEFLSEVERTIASILAHSHQERFTRVPHGGPLRLPRSHRVWRGEQDLTSRGGV